MIAVDLLELIPDDDPVYLDRLMHNRHKEDHMTTLSPVAMTGTTDLPTYRQIDYWCRAGLLGADKQNLGSGRPRTWTDHELAKLRSLHRISRDLNSLGLRLTGDVIARVWHQLDDAPTATITEGGITITAEIDP